MATKRQKKEKAKSYLPTIPAPILRLTPAGRLYQTSSLVAQALIDADPLGIITDDPVNVRTRSSDFIGPMLPSPEKALETVVNDPQIKLSPEVVEAINDDSMMMVGNEIVQVPRSRQFSRANIVGGINLESPKRSRKKTKTDKNMSKALRMANDRFRKKNGSLRKGATQAKIMKYAHKLLKKM